MNEETRPVDYRRAKISALQALAAGGDAAAVQELSRRGVAIAPATDVRTLDYAGLRALVLAWNAGAMPADRERSRALAFAAQAELEARYRTDEKLHDGRGPRPQPPPLPPWRWPRAPRCEPWQRPAGSTNYPSDVDYLRAQLAELHEKKTRNRAAGEP